MVRNPTPTEVVEAALKALTGGLVKVEYVFNNYHLDVLATPGSDTCTREMPISGQVYRHSAWLTTLGDPSDKQFSFGVGSFIADHVDSLHVESGEDYIIPTIRLSKFWVAKIVKDPHAVRALLNF